MAGIKVLFVRPPHSEKTNTLRRLRGEEGEEHLPTVGANIRPVSVGSYFYTVWDIGSQYKNLYYCYSIGADVVVYFGKDTSHIDELKLWIPHVLYVPFTGLGNLLVMMRGGFGLNHLPYGRQYGLGGALPAYPQVIAEVHRRLHTDEEVLEERHGKGGGEASVALSSQL